MCKNEPLAPDNPTPEAQVQYMMDLRDAWWSCWSVVKWNADYWGR